MDRIGESEGETAFRRRVERRKTRILARRVPVTHPATLTGDEFAVARRNIDATPWGADWFAQMKAQTDYVLAQADDYIERMIPTLTPTNPYGFTCPHCVGVQSQEGGGYHLVQWDFHHPEVIRCVACGQALPDAAYPETGILACPRAGQTFTYYLNPNERAHPDDRSGAQAWQWVWKPAHPSYSGIVREKKVLFMLDACRNLALLYRFTGDFRYAAKVVRILERLAVCYRNWLYHDFYDTIADGDPLYAAWHDMSLPLAWKRNPTGMAYANTTYETGPLDDQPDRAKMLATFFGCGRIHPSADSGVLDCICQAYDLVYDAADGDGQPLWSAASQRLVERELILECLIGAEPFVGGPGKATNLCNKAPYVYKAMAMAARCLGLPDYAHVALKGYEALRDHAFYFDGFSGESPAYTDMFLSSILWVPERLHGFRWPEGYRKRRGAVDVYAQDAKLRLMLRATRDSLRPDGRFLPLSDTPVFSSPSAHVCEIGLIRYPEYYAGALPMLYRAQTAHRREISADETAPLRPTEYALFHLDAENIARDTGLPLPETFFPAWMTAILRHGAGTDAAVLALACNPPGIHRHRDNLTLYYAAHGRTVLGEQGYVCDTPQIDWAHATQCHNLVVVDDAEQLFWEKNDSPRSRVPSLRMMATSPLVSAVEAESRIYAQCSAYRRLVALIKGPGVETFVVDIFRVSGGGKHSYRLFSEVSASDAPESRREFVGLNMSPDAPFPEPGRSLRPEDVFGLRDIRVADQPPAAWQAIWQERDRRYRFWMLSSVDRVEASNGPGQETLDQAGRRVRYLDAVRKGDDLDSTFVAIHEPGGHETMPILRAEQLPVSIQAGACAVALRIASHWGDYLIFSEFEREAEIDGVRFQGTFGVFFRGTDGKRHLFSCGATTLMADDFGHAQAPARWRGRIVTQSDDTFATGTECPANWPATPAGTTGYVLTGRPGQYSGFAVAEVDQCAIRVERFPLQPAHRFLLLATRLYSE